MLNPSDLVKQLTEQRRRLSALVRLLKEASEEANYDELNEIMERVRKLERLDKAAEPLDPKRDAVQQVRGWVQQRRQELDDKAEQAKRRVGAKLESALKPLGLTLSGQMPELKAGLFTIELIVDATRARIWYGPKEERLGESSLAPPDIAQCVMKIREALGSRLEPDALVDRLHEAYQRAGRCKGTQGHPIVRILAELAPLVQGSRFREDPRAEHYKSYGRADFSFDLFRLRGAEGQSLFPQKFRLRGATRTHTQRRQDFLWVPDDERTGVGQRYSHIQFSESKP